MKDTDSFLVEQLGKYKAWCYMLRNKIKGETKMYEDRKILSPKNIIIEGWKE